MHPIRTGLGIDRRQCGPRFVVEAPLAAVAAPESGLQQDLKLFGVTFAAGFLFVSIFFA